MKLPNPLIPGFNPDPSIVKVGDDYYVATSTFEYLPGLPIYHSTDLVDWELLGHVIERPEQFDATAAPTNGGMWAPTIRHHDGRFWVIVAAMGLPPTIYTATDPAGPWSDGTPIPALSGIDPDLAWDDEGTCFVTYSGLILSGPERGSHLGIMQARIDPESGEALEEPRSMWSGTGLMFPEAPHLYRIDEWWYLLLAEGGTERGHAVSIARSATPDGPFEGCPSNPVLSARSTARPVQNTGHGDLVLAPDGSWSMVLLGMRTRGMTRSFSAHGRQTFGTHVEWVDGWPVVDPVELDPERRAPVFFDDFGGDALGPEWIGVRRMPGEVSSLEDGRLVVSGDGATMSDAQPAFVGRRQRRDDARIFTIVHDPSTGVGGLSVRYDEQHHYDLEIGGGSITARACIATLAQERSIALAPGPVELVLEMRPNEGGFDQGTDLLSLATCDRIAFVVIDAAGERTELMEADGRFLSAESTCSFTGRVVGLYCVAGTLAFDRYAEEPLA